MNVCCCQIRCDYWCIDTFSRPLFFIAVSAVALVILKKLGAFKVFQPIDAWRITKDEALQRDRIGAFVASVGCLFVLGVLFLALECYSEPPCRRIRNELEEVN